MKSSNVLKALVWKDLVIFLCLMSLESRNSSLPSFQEKLVFRLCSLGKADLRSHFCLELHLHCSSLYSPFRVRTPLLLLASLPAVISLSASSALSQQQFIHPLNIFKLRLTLFFCGNLFLSLCLYIYHKIFCYCHFLGHCMIGIVKIWLNGYVYHRAFWKHTQVASRT